MGTFNKTLLNSNFLKNLYKICTKILNSFSKLFMNKILKHLRNFQNFSESVEHLK